jgi:hypothetical protein
MLHCNNLTMNCASKQRELHPGSPKCTSAALKMSPTKGLQCAEHCSLDGWHGLTRPQPASKRNRCCTDRVSPAQRERELTEFAAVRAGRGQRHLPSTPRWQVACLHCKASLQAFTARLHCKASVLLQVDVQSTQASRTELSYKSYHIAPSAKQ